MQGDANRDHIGADIEAQIPARAEVIRPAYANSGPKTA